jgi:hypothetical protein
LCLLAPLSKVLSVKVASPRLAGRFLKSQFNDFMTDPDGTLYQSSEGKPRAVTVWGTKGEGDEYAKPVVKCEMKKEHRHVIEWDAEFFEWVETAADKFSKN